MTRALADAGWSVAPALGRGDDLRDAAEDVELLLLAVPDAAIEGVAATVRPVDGCVVAHLAGSLGLDVLAPHVRRAAVHPLVSIPTGETVLRGGWFAIAGDPLAAEVVADLRGRSVAVADEDRARYHAAACIASNHLVGLLGQVERVAASAGVPLEAFLALARQSIDNVSTHGPRDALTGPVRRGDRVTVDRHRAELPVIELDAYDAGVELCERLMVP
jgi:predicted short-subunit dehydrogenase-like oxidoreductase (DUF2520 family)